MKRVVLRSFRVVHSMDRRLWLWTTKFLCLGCSIQFLVRSSGHCELRTPAQHPHLMTLWYFVQFWPRNPRLQGSALTAVVVLEVACGLFCFFAAVLFRNAIRIYKSGFDASRVAGNPQVYRWGAASQFLAFFLLAIFYICQRPSISMILVTAYVVMSFADCQAHCGGRLHASFRSIRRKQDRRPSRFPADDVLKVLLLKHD